MTKKIKMRDVCIAASVGPATVRRWVKNKQFPAPVRVGRSWLFDLAAVEAALAGAAPRS